MPVLIRNLWQLKAVIFLHWCLIHAVLLFINGKKPFLHWCLICAVLLFINGKKHFEEQVVVAASPTKQAAQLGRWADKAVGLGNCICASFNFH